MILRGPQDNAGQYTKGEKPAPLQYQYLDANGTALPITGYTVKALLRELAADPSTTQTLNGSVADGPNGIAQYTWTGNEWTTPGKWLMEFWAGNGTQRFASVIITMDVAISIGSPPNI
jgi:hypothetical protein